MTTTATPYGCFYLDLGAAVHTFGTDTDKVALLTSSYTPDFDNHTSYADVSTAEVAASSSYTAGGLALISPAWAYDASNDRAQLSSSTITWTGLTATFRYAVVYKATGTPTTSKLIGLIDFGADRSYAGEDFALQFTNGVLRVRQATS